MAFCFFYLMIYQKNLQILSELRFLLAENESETHVCWCNMVNHDTWCCWSCLFLLCLVRGWTICAPEKSCLRQCIWNINPLQSDLNSHYAHSTELLWNCLLEDVVLHKYEAPCAFCEIKFLPNKEDDRKLPYRTQHKNTIAWKLQFAKKVKNLTVATLCCTENPDYCYQDKPGGGSLSCYNSSLKHFFCVSSFKCGFKLENMHFWSSFQVQ